MRQFNFVASPSLKQLAYEKLQQMIIQGELQPGTRLTEEELSQAMNVSRAPIREALNMLERDGFVRIIPRKGAIVSEVSIRDSIDLWQCRIALEPFAAQEACGHIPQSELEQALAHIRELEVQYDFEKYIASDLEVHELYYNYLDNLYMRSIFENLKAHSLRIRWLQERENPGKKTATQSIHEHSVIVEALLCGDREAVYSAVQNHIRNAAERMFGEQMDGKAEKA